MKDTTEFNTSFKGVATQNPVPYSPSLSHHEALAGQIHHDDVWAAVQVMDANPHPFSSAHKLSQGLPDD